MPRFAAVTLLFTFLVAVERSEAQTISGSIVSADSAQAIPGAILQLFDAEETQVAIGRSTPDGSFRIAFAGPAGRYRLQVDAFGFERASIEVPLDRGMAPIALPEFRLAVSPFVLEDVRVDVDRGRLLSGREWIIRNQRHGTGTFLAGAVIALDSPRSLGDYLASRTRLMTRFDERGQARLRSPGARGACLTVLVNRWPIDRTGFRSIDEIPVESIAAIEVYERERDLPPGYWFDASAGCGVVQVWTWGSW